MLRYNLGNIVRAVRARGVPVLVMNYPRPFWENAIIEKEAAALGIPLVDNGSVFKEHLRADGSCDPRLFVPDGHCTGEGYRIMAENVYRELIRQGYIPQDR
jgi:lysophospholipase L1-like esterase